MTNVRPSLRGWLRASCWTLCWLWVATLASCGSFEEKRIRELLHEKGFGSRAQGDATRENYVGGLDQVQFLLSPNMALVAGAERLAELTVVQPVGIDGTIFVPYIGPVYVLGLTENQLGDYVTQQLQSVFQKEIGVVQARIVNTRKHFYAIGEVRRGKGRVPMEPDMTLLDAIFLVGWTDLANLGRINLIRPDAENPMVVDVNVREMMTTGYTTANLQIREHDILFVPPTFLGLIARLLQRILEPVGLAVRTMLGWAEIRSAYDYLTGESDYYYRF